MRTGRPFVAACTIALLIGSAALSASTVVLKDGRTFSGEVRKLGNNYRIVQPDGSNQIVAVGDVVSIDGKSTTPGADTSGKPAVPAAGGAPTAAAVSGGASFKAAKSKADRAEAPIVAVQIWEQWIADNASSPDLAAANTEKAAWDTLYKAKAEKVKGKWISGKELKDLKKKCDELLVQAIDPGDDGVRGLAGLKKLDEIIALYPNHFAANFYKGYYYLVQAIRTTVGRNDALAKAMVSLERTAAIAPESPEVWGNLAIGYNFRREYEKSIAAAYRAVKIRDDEQFVATLATAIYTAPPQMREVNEKVRKINDDAQVLMSRYGIKPAATWRYLRPTQRPDDNTEVAEVKRPIGVLWSGSGFFVSADGYLLTNHHVATGDPEKPADPALTYRVRLEDGTEVPADLVAVDDKADIALMKAKLKPGQTVGFLPVADVNPNQGADAMVLGYPANGLDELTLQISVGKVKSVNTSDDYHVWFDLNTTHGNSGGPIVDKYGRVIAILTGGRTTYNQTICLGVGPDQIESFLKGLGAKVPWKPNYAPVANANDLPLNSEKLTQQCRPATLMVIAINGDPTKPAPVAAQP